ncbi:MAG: hypothetical protein AAB658_12055, partial [Chloroflexota bacterium]
MTNQDKDVQHAHDLAKLASNLAVVRELPPEKQSRFYECNRELAKQRIVSAYGTDDGVPPDTIFDRTKAE